METTRKVRLVAYTNDALGLAAGNFNFPIFQWKTASQTTQSISELLQDETWRIRIRNIRELMSINPEKVYTTIPERLSGLPKGYTLKIELARCLYEGEAELHFLDFCRDTIHKTYSTDKTYQDYVVHKIEEAWNLCEDYYKDFPEIGMMRFRPSVLVLERVDGDEDLAGDFDFLANVMSHLWQENNPVSKVMYEILWRVERKRGTWEYVPYD